MLSTCFALALLAAPPEGGLKQAFAKDETFLEQIAVDVVSTSTNDEATKTQLHYEIELVTVTEEVESAEKALLESRVQKLVVETKFGNLPPASYDSSAQDIEGSIDEAARDANTLAELWRPYNDISVKRFAAANGSLTLNEFSELTIAARTSRVTEAFGQSISTLVSTTLPAGPLDSWTDEINWPTAGGSHRVLRLYTYKGRDDEGNDSIEISAAAIGEDGKTRLEDPPLVAKGRLLFNRQLKRIVAIDLVAEMKQPQVVRTTVAWRLTPAPELNTANTAP